MEATTRMPHPACRPTRRPNQGAGMRGTSSHNSTRLTVLVRGVG